MVRKSKILRKGFSFKLDIKTFELRTLALPLLSGLFCIVIFFLLLVPKAKEITAFRNKAKKLKVQRQEFLAKVQLLSSLDEEEMKTQGALATLALPVNKDVSLILFTLTEPVKRNGFYLSQFEFNLGEVEGEAGKEKELGKEKKPAAPIDKIKAKMSLIGPEERVAPLLLSLEKGLPLMEIGDFEYRTNEGGSVQLSMMVTLFYSSQRVSYKPELIKIKDLALSKGEAELLARLGQFKKNEAVFAHMIKGQPSSLTGKGRENPFASGEQAGE